MLEILDKFSVYIAAAILGYLVYSTLERPGFSIETEKELPVITKQMLNPELIDPNNNASPAGRDPFEVEWATYYDITEFTGITETTDEIISGQDYKPVFDKMLMGIISGNNGRNVALIDGEVYEVGSLIDGTDPNKCWMIDAIKKDEVIVRLGRHSETLYINSYPVQDDLQGQQMQEEFEQ